MEITYDPQAEAIYIRIAKSNVKVDHTDTLQEGRIMIDKDRKGNIFGIEVLYIKKLDIKVGR